MKINEKQIQHMAKSLMDAMKAQKVIEFKEKEEVVLQKVIEVIKSDFLREAQLDQDVHRMMDDLERQNPGQFQRYKMFPLLKKRLAQERGIIL